MIIKSADNSLTSMARGWLFEHEKDSPHRTHLFSSCLVAHKAFAVPPLHISVSRNGLHFLLRFPSRFCLFLFDRSPQGQRREGYQPSTQPPTRRTRGPHLIWSQSFDLFGMCGPTRNQRLLADIALLDCKTVRIFAYSSTREQSNKGSEPRLKTESETEERH